MNLLSANGLKKRYAAHTIFEDISIALNKGEKAALIGINGCGKTTLLKILAGIESPDEGDTAIEGSSSVSYLPQLPNYNENDSVLEFIFNSGAAETKLISEYEDAVRKVADNPENMNAVEKMAELSDKIDALDAWEYEREVTAVLDSLDIKDLDKKMSELSGGMVKKTALAKTLIDKSEIIFLDEPTNHLDIQTIVWLEDRLQKMNKTLLMVTHDRYFLDSVCNVILEIEDGKLYRYNGNYAYYLEKYAERKNAAMKEEERVNSILRRELQWLQRGPKARSLKQKARKERAYELMDREGLKEEKNIELHAVGHRLGKKILNLKNVSKSFGDNLVIKSFTHAFNKNEKTGVIGPNGSGKTTLLNMINGSLESDSGSIEVGMNTKFGYFDQHSEKLDAKMRVLEYIKEHGTYIESADGEKISASSLLERFLFPPHKHYTRISELSGGERRRLYLLSVLIKNPNFLILDEPTNDLDIKTLSILEDYLQSFQGCVITVSHDRYFMDRVCDYYIVFDKEKNLKTFIGSYSDYLELEKEQERKKFLEEKQQRKKENDSYNARKKDAAEKKKLSYNEKREFEMIEKEIEKLETKQESIKALFEDPNTSGTKIAELSDEYKALEDELEAKLRRWEELAERA